VLLFKGTPSNPLTPEEIRGKVKLLAGAVLSPQKITELIEKVQRLEEVKDMATIL